MQQPASTAEIEIAFAPEAGSEALVLLDDKGNRGQASVAAMNLIVGALIALRVVST